MWTAHLLSESGVDSHRLFFPVWYSAHRSLGASLMKHRPTVAYFSPADSGRSGLSKGDTAGKRAPWSVFLGPNYPYRTVLNQENLDLYSEAGVFILDMLDILLSRNRLEFKKKN